MGAILYLALVFFPQIAFAHTLSYKSYRVYTTEPLGDELPALRAVLDEVDRRLTTSEVYDSAVIHRVFLTPSHRWFAFFAPGSRGAFAVNRQVLHYVLVNESDLAANVVRSGRGSNGRRDLDGVLAHEITHTLLARRFGNLRLLQAQVEGRGLREEGYCDFVAQETSFDPERGAAMLRRGERERSASFEYFRWSTAVRQLVDVEGRGVEQVLFGEWDVEDVLARATLPSPTGPER